MHMDAGFIGLGNMGQAMARNLLKAGHRVTVYNRTRSKAEALEREGARVASSLSEACASGVVATMLSDDAAVEQAALGPNGIIAALKPGGVHVSHSTISPALSRRLTEEHGKAGQQYIAAPVFGRPESAEQAKLVVLAAGPTEGIARVQPLLDAIGQKTFALAPEPWKANVVKLSGNFLLAAMIECFGEIYAVLRKSDIDPKQWLEIVNGSVFKSPVFENYGKIIAEERFEPAGFKLKLGLKDVKLAMGAAEDVAVPMPFASVLRDRFLAAIGHGEAEKDWSAITAEARR